MAVYHSPGIEGGFDMSIILAALLFGPSGLPEMIGARSICRPALRPCSRASPARNATACSSWKR